MTKQSRKTYVFDDTISGYEIKQLRKQLAMTQREFAAFLQVSHKTVENWEQSAAGVSGPIAVLYRILTTFPQLENYFELPTSTEPLQFLYMYKNQPCTWIAINEAKKKITIKNFTEHAQFKAFGNNLAPTYEDWLFFIESRCFPRTRDKLKLVLKDLDLPYYDPMLIIEKTQGRMAEDDFWFQRLRIENTAHSF